MKKGENNEDDEKIEIVLVTHPFRSMKPGRCDICGGDHTSDIVLDQDSAYQPH